MATGFNKIYKRFYSKVTDDMYMELDQAQTDALLFELLENAIDWFEFPRVNLNNYDKENECFNVTLSNEEANILATYMLVGWFDQQLATVENTRMKYSGSDFKFTSQANHMAKLKNLRSEYERIGFHLQRLYKRRKADSNGIMKSTLGDIMASSVRGGTRSASSNSNSNSGSSNGGSGSADNSWDDMTDSSLTPDNNGSADSWGDLEDLPSGGNNSPAADDNWDSV